MESKGSAPDGRGGRVSNQCVPRRAADTLANPINDADGEKLAWGEDQSSQRTHQSRHGIAEDNEALSPPRLIGLASRPELYATGDRISDAFDDTQVKAIAQQDREQFPDLSGDFERCQCRRRDFDLRERWNVLTNLWKGQRHPIHNTRKIRRTPMLIDESR